MPEATGEKQESRNDKGQFVPGQSGNPDGRPKGSLGFATKWRIFLDKLAETNGVTPDDIEAELLAVAYKKAQKGDYNFWRDIFDRVYGKPSQPISGDSENPLEVEHILSEDAEKLLRELEDYEKGIDSKKVAKKSKQSAGRGRKKLDKKKLEK